MLRIAKIPFKEWTIFAWSLLCLILLFGCSSSDKNDYSVFFDESVMIFDEIVYHNYTPIGRVDKIEISSTNRTLVTVQIDPMSSFLMNQNAVFYVKTGQLHLTSIAPFGEPLETNATLLGFTSKTDLNLFHLKNIFTDKVIAARHIVEKLESW